EIGQGAEQPIVGFLAGGLEGGDALLGGRPSLGGGLGAVLGGGLGAILGGLDLDDDPRLDLGVRGRAGRAAGRRAGLVWLDLGGLVAHRRRLPEFHGDRDGGPAYFDPMSWDTRSAVK